jgi:hypothetical protein
MGMSPAEIAATYPTITLSAVHAALAYYYAHKSEIDAEVEAGERLVEEMKSKAGPSRLRQRLAELGRAADNPFPPG